MAIVEESVRVVAAEVCLDATDGKIHLCHLPCGRVGVLAIYSNVVYITTMVFYKLCTLHEHASRSAAGVIYAAIVRLQHFDQCANHAGGSIEFTSQLAFLFGKLGKAVFICSAEDIAAAACVNHLNVGEQVNHITQTALVQFGTSEVLGEDILQSLVFFFDRSHCIVDHGADFGSVRLGSNDAPAGSFGYEENAFGNVLIHIFLKTVAFFHELLVLFVEAIGNVLEENQSQNDGFIFGCVDVAAQHTRCVPYLFFKADAGCIVCHIYSPYQYIYLFPSFGFGTP